MKHTNIPKLVFAIPALMVPSISQAVTVSVGPSTDAWIGFMNVSELPANGGGFVFASGWGVGDLVATFDDSAETLAFSPNTIGDPNEFWYQNTSGMAADPTNPGGPGQLGNKIMEANLFIQSDGGLAGQTVDFVGNISNFSLTSAHTFEVFIKDFSPDFSTVVTSSAPITASGAFSISLDTINDTNRHVQYGFTMTGENVWVTDVAPFGSVGIATVPEPSAALLGLLGLGLLSRRRRA